MKNLIFLFLFLSGSLLAAPALVIENNSNKGKEQKALLFEKTDLVIIKNSNKYDSKTDYRLGIMRLKKSDELYIAEERLKQISMALVTAEKTLQRKGTSFKKLDQDANPHGDKMYLDKVLITEGSTYYSELKKIILDLDTAPYRLETGKQISKDKKQIETVKNGNVASKEDFIIPFFCDEPKFPASCTIRDAGTLYIK
jgi:hypothetical protein